MAKDSTLIARRSGRYLSGGAAGGSPSGGLRQASGLPPAPATVLRQSSRLPSAPPATLRQASSLGGAGREQRERLRLALATASALGWLAAKEEAEMSTMRSQSSTWFSLQVGRGGGEGVESAGGGEEGRLRGEEKGGT